MLQITIPGVELYDEVNGKFITTKSQTVRLEHSLVSISKWEAKWHKAFLGKQPKTVEESNDYIRCMNLTQNVDPEIFRYIPKSVYDEINAYIENPMTATVLRQMPNQGTGKGDTVTSELIYYWMISLDIPVELCEKWHINRLLTLIRLCNVKNGGYGKMSKRDMLAGNMALNRARRGRH